MFINLSQLSYYTEDCSVCGNIERTKELDSFSANPCFMAMACEICPLDMVCDESCFAYEYSLKKAIIEASKN